MDNLPIHIVNMIVDLVVDVKQFWKNRFSTDVLPQIDKVYRLVGLYCPRHKYKPCRCNKTAFIPCANCYCYGNEDCNYHLHYEAVSYAQIVDHSSFHICYPYFPMDVFKYYFSCDAEFDSPSSFKLIRKCKELVTAKENSMELIKTQTV